MLDKDGYLTWGDVWRLGVAIACGTLLLCTIMALACISPVLDYKVKMRALTVVQTAVDKGVEIRLNGDLLKGMEVINCTSKR